MGKADMSSEVVRCEGVRARLQIVWEYILQTTYSTFLLGVLLFVHVS